MVQMRSTAAGKMLYNGERIRSYRRSIADFPPVLVGFLTKHRRARASALKSLNPHLREPPTSVVHHT